MNLITQNWRIVLSGAAIITIGLGLAQILSSIIFSDSTKTYHQYTWEVLNSEAIEKLAHSQMDQMRTRVDVTQSASVDWLAAEGAFAICIRREILEWVNSDDLRITRKITSHNVGPRAKQFTITYTKRLTGLSEECIVKDKC
jgi:hypothetical protein